MESPYPDIERARAIARQLLRSARRGDPAALARMPRADRTPRMADALFAVARTAGFPSWPALVRAVEDWQRGGGNIVATRLLLVKHPQRVADGRVHQHGGSGLSETGGRGAHQLARSLAREAALDVDAVLSSRRPPSEQTAAILADALGLAPGVATCELCDMHYGEAEGMNRSEFQRRYGTNALVPGAETWDALIARTTTALRAIADRHRGQTVICVTENGVVHASLVALGGADALTAYNTPIAPGSITEWTVLVEGDLRRVGTWSLDRLNDTAHLDDSDATVDTT